MEQGLVNAVGVSNYSGKPIISSHSSIVTVIDDFF